MTYEELVARYDRTHGVLSRKELPPGSRWPLYSGLWDEGFLARFSFKINPHMPHQGLQMQCVELLRTDEDGFMDELSVSIQEQMGALLIKAETTGPGSWRSLGWIDSTLLVRSNVLSPLRAFLQGLPVNWTP